MRFLSAGQSFCSRQYNALNLLAYQVLMQKFIKTNLTIGAMVLCVLSFEALSTPARAQGVFSMGSLTNSLSMGGVIQSEKARARKNYSSVRNADVSSAKTKRGLITQRNIGAFKPSATVRKRNIATFLSQLRRVDRESAAVFEKDFASRDIFGIVNQRLKPYGMNTNNLADTMTIYLVSSWQHTRGERREPTKAQYLGAREQMAQAIGNVPSITSTSNLEKQQAADMILLSALLADSYVEAAKKQPASLPKIRAAVAQNAQVRFGLNMNDLKLTNKGFH